MMMDLVTVMRCGRKDEIWRHGRFPVYVFSPVYDLTTLATMSLCHAWWLMTMYVCTWWIVVLFAIYSLHVEDPEYDGSVVNAIQV